MLSSSVDWRLRIMLILEYVLEEHTEVLVCYIYVFF
jgi:hypothetical protein